MKSKRSLVLVSRNLQTRSYIRAQLIEEGIEVSAFISLDDARHWMFVGGRVPGLVLVDMWRMPLEPEFINWMKDLSDRAPLLFLTGARQRLPPAIQGLGDAIRRPVSVGQVVSRVRSTLD